MKADRMPKLTAEECKVAAERAKKYPRGWGYSYLSKRVPRDALRLSIDANTAAREMYDDGPQEIMLTAPVLAGAWLRDHPEDEPCGCPAVAIAAARGELNPDGVHVAFIDLLGHFGWVGPEYCDLLSYSPVYVAERLEAESVKLAKREVSFVVDTDQINGTGV
jgi:hypothetical protein